MPRSIEQIKPFQFRKGQSGNPTGRPRSRIKSLLSELSGCPLLFRPLRNHELAEIDAALLTMSTEQLAKAANDTAIPAIMRAKAIAILRDMREGKMTAITQIQERVAGKPKAVDTAGAEVDHIGEFIQNLAFGEAVANQEEQEEEDDPADVAAFLAQRGDAADTDTDTDTGN